MEQRDRVAEGRELQPLHVLIPQTLTGKHRAAGVGRNETGRDVCFALDLPKSSLKRDQSSLYTRSEQFKATVTKWVRRNYRFISSEHGADPPSAASS